MSNKNSNTIAVNVVTRKEAVNVAKKAKVNSYDSIIGTLYDCLQLLDKGKQLIRDDSTIPANIAETRIARFDKVKTYLNKAVNGSITALYGIEKKAKKEADKIEKAKTAKIKLAEKLETQKEKLLALNAKVKSLTEATS